MTKTAKIIWTTAALLGAVSLFFNFREIPQDTPPPLKNGEFLCLSRAESGTLTSIKNFFGA